MKKITLLALTIWFLGASCEKSDNIEKPAFNQSNEISSYEYDYQNIKRNTYSYLDNNWDKNLEENEKYFIEALNTNEDFIRTRTINEDKIITVDIKFKFDYSDEAISSLSSLYSAIYNAPVKDLKKIFNDQKNILVNNEKLTGEDYDVLYPIYASFDANIEFIVRKYRNLNSTTELERSSIIDIPSLRGLPDPRKTWFDCMLESGGTNISRGLVEGAIGGAIGGATVGATGGTVVLPLVGTATGAVGGGVFGAAFGAGTGMFGGFLWSSVDCFTKTGGGNSGGSSGSGGGCAITVPINPNDPRFKGIHPINNPSYYNVPLPYKFEILTVLQDDLSKLQEVSPNSSVIIKLNNK